MRAGLVLAGRLVVATNVYNLALGLGISFY